jgi:hypothetical protein
MHFSQVPCYFLFIGCKYPFQRPLFKYPKHVSSITLHIKSPSNTKERENVHFFHIYIYTMVQSHLTLDAEHVASNVK